MFVKKGRVFVVRSRGDLFMLHGLLNLEDLVLHGLGVVQGHLLVQRVQLGLHLVVRVLELGHPSLRGPAGTGAARPRGSSGIPSP
jgi:hypothetical protein